MKVVEHGDTRTWFKGIFMLDEYEYALDTNINQSEQAVSSFTCCLLLFWGGGGGRFRL